MTPRVLQMAEADAIAAGPKAATLARAAAAGLPVPPFVVISADVYREHAERAGIARAGAGPISVTDAAAIRASILEAPLAPGLLGDIATAVMPLGSRLAVRSSGTAEDLPGLSFAGQYESVLDAGPDDVRRAVLECWASLWSDRAVAYREQSGIAHDAVAMAVIVQRFVPADAGGVAFTADPVTGERTVIVESCTQGAEAIVSGRVTPERSVLDRADLEHSPADLPHAVGRLALSAEELLRLPADIEWVWAGQRLWLLQARPITTVPRYRATGWSNVNTGEVLPDVVTPMTWSIVGRLATGLMTALFGKLGIRVDTMRLTTLIAGRAYFNASLLSSAFEQIPMRGSEDITSIFGGMPAPPGWGDLPGAPEDTARVSTLRAILGMPLVLVWFARHSPRAANRLCTRIHAETDAALRDIAAAPDEDALAAVTNRVVHGLDTMVDAIAFSGVAMAYHGQFLGAAKRHFGEDGPALANTLMAGQGGVASAEAGLALARLGRQARTHPKVADALMTSTSWAEVRPRLAALAPDGQAFLDAWDAFMSEYGHHARGELEFYSPRWSEQPDDVLAMVVGLLGVTAADDLVAAYEARGKRAATEEDLALLALGPLARARFRWLLANARAGARTRENAKNEGVRALAAGRVALLALGGAMSKRGLLTRADDIVFLAWDEVPQVRAGTLAAAPLVASRRAEYERNRALNPPSVVIGEWDGRAAETTMSAIGDTLTGLGVSSGVARGPARVIHSLQSSERVLPGEVLVAPFTDPGWTPYFIPAVGIVVDMGGMLSHGSIIAREYGIPGVVNVGHGTTSIRTGDIVEVDGSRGVVTVVERA